MKVICPVSFCRAVNDVHTEECKRCGIPLRAYARLALYPAHLFNSGLDAARQGNMKRAREFFAAVVHWCPMDSEARNALAMACFGEGDFAEARYHWETVLTQFTSDPIARRGLDEIAAATESRKPSAVREPSKGRSGKKRRRSKERR